MDKIYSATSGKIEPGYQGYDSMRKDAEEMDYLVGVGPRTYSHPKKESYKKGGKVMKGEEKEKTSQSVREYKKLPTDLKIPRKLSSARPVDIPEFAHGGTIYEKQMVGMRPSKDESDINYESDMRGMKKEKMQRGGIIDYAIREMKGPRSKYAAGGAAKVRKGMATAEGEPIHKRRNKKNAA